MNIDNLCSPSAQVAVGMLHQMVSQDLPTGFCDDRPWGKGNNPKTAVREYLNRLEAEGRVDPSGRPIQMEIDNFIEHKIAIKAAPDGFLRRV